ncbi:alpha-1,2-fucosyltransferase [Spirochaetia bacterium]|nr:alpha-1,2-fucosyltransferase [Spirochaetia bacterium]
MKQNTVCVVLRGRIGNQLFIYAMARAVQRQIGGTSKICIDDSEVLAQKWVNSLEQYNLKDVEYVHNRKQLYEHLSPVQLCVFLLYRWMVRESYRYITKKKTYMEKHQLEKKYQKCFNRFGLILCENGYIPYSVNSKKNVFISGYFQSEQYFSEITPLIRQELALGEQLCSLKYPGIDGIKTRNAVCVSIKVEHNVGSASYEVCKKEYWEQAIAYIIEQVENPLFFVCSDNVEYVMKNLIDCAKYNVVCQSAEYPVHITLSVMSLCKHFIIGNTTYGWWAVVFPVKHQSP